MIQYVFLIINVYVKGGISTRNSTLIVCLKMQYNQGIVKLDYKEKEVDMTDELLIEIRDLLKEINTNQNQLPKLLYSKHIAENYSINLNKATEFCQKYGINFGGWCIETTKFQEILHNSNGNLFE